MSNPAIVRCLQSVPVLAEQFSHGGNLIRPDWEKMAEAVEEHVGVVDETDKLIVARLREELGLDEGDADADIVDAIVAALQNNSQALSDAAERIEDLERQLEVQNAQLQAIANAKPVDVDAAPAG